MDLSKVVTEAFAPHHISNVVAGISGGADSTALLVALSNANIDVTAIHCNFNLRGSESDGDESFVRTLCDSLGIRLKVCNFDVNAYVSSHKVSVEMACRELRYDAFREVMSETGAQRIAVAHNSDDQVETLMLNLLRGTGISGLRAMREDTGEIIRPFINITRREIEEYLREMGFTWRTDSTNLESHYLRNFLRNDVLPLLETRWPRARKSLLRTSSNLSSDEKVLADIEERLIPLDSELLLSETVRNFCNPEWNIRRFARRYGASDRQIEEITEAMLDKDRHSGAFWHVNGGEIHLERNGIEFLSDNLPTWDICVKSHHMTPELQELIKHADSDTLWTPLPPDEIEWREPGPGDRIKLLGTAGSVLVSKVMKDAHLSSRMKRLVKIAVRKSDGEIIAIPGLKRSRESLIDFNRDFMVWEYREKRNS